MILITFRILYKVYFIYRRHCPLFSAVCHSQISWYTYPMWFQSESSRYYILIVKSMLVLHNNKYNIT